MANKTRAAFIAQLSSQLFLAIILFQVPLFSVPCKTGICNTPIQLTAVQLASSKSAPQPVLKALLFPGKCVHALLHGTELPTWDGILTKYNMSNIGPLAQNDLQRLEVLIGSYFAVAGAIVGVFKQGRMSMFGMLVITWGLIREGMFSQSSPVQASPALFLALALGFLSVRYDLDKVRKVTGPAAKPLKGSTKTKVK